MSERKKLHFKRTPPGTGYHAGQVVSVPADIADKMVAGGYAGEPTPVLPNDMPGRDALIAAGYESIDQVDAVKDLTKITGIGKATAEQLSEYLGREGEEE